MLRFLSLALALTLTDAFSLTSMLNVAPRRAIVSLKESAARKAWIAKLEEPIGARSLSLTEELAKINEDEAKRAWLDRLDVPAWGKAADAIATLAADAFEVAEMTEKCDSGDTAACQSLSAENEAKKAWLEKLDVPAWGAAAKLMSDVAIAASTKEDEAKKAWLSRLDTPTWGEASQLLKNVVDALAKEEEAKQAWLSKLDAPEWGKINTAVSEGANAAASDEAVAKAAWLAKVDAELNARASWTGKVAPTAVDVSAAVPVALAAAAAPTPEAVAKAAWLAKLDD